MARRDLVSLPAMKAGLKPSLATTRAKASRRVARPSGAGRTNRRTGERFERSSLEESCERPVQPCARRYICSPLQYIKLKHLSLSYACFKLESPAEFVAFFSLNKNTQKMFPIYIHPELPLDPSQRKFLSLESTERGVASMSAGAKA